MVHGCCNWKQLHQQLTCTKHTNAVPWLQQRPACCRILEIGKIRDFNPGIPITGIPAFLPVPKSRDFWKTGPGFHFEAERTSRSKTGSVLDLNDETIS